MGNLYLKNEELSRKEISIEKLLLRRIHGATCDHHIINAVESYIKDRLELKHFKIFSPDNNYEIV